MKSVTNLLDEYMLLTLPGKTIRISRVQTSLRAD